MSENNFSTFEPKSPNSLGNKSNLSSSRFGRGLGEKKRKFGKRFNNTKNNTLKKIPVRYQLAEDRLKQFKANLLGQVYDPKDTGAQPVTVRKVQAPIQQQPLPQVNTNQQRQQYVVPELNLDENFRPYSTSGQINSIDDIFDRSTKQQISLNSLIYEPVKEPFWKKFKFSLPKFRLPQFQSPFRNLTLAGNRFLIAMFIFSMTFAAGSFYLSSNGASLSWSSINRGAVAGVNETIVEDENYRQYLEWIQENTGSTEPAEGDIDQDQLTNYEEFIIGTDPTNSNTCDPELTDIEILMELRNPVTCQDMDLDDGETINYYSQILNLPDVIAYQETTDEDAATPAASEEILDLFDVQSYSEIDEVSINEFEQNILEKTDKIELLRLIERVDQYVKNNRSYEIYDRNYNEPVHPAVYIDVARKYDTPLKYVLAIARLESRFGTDRFTNSGNLTRPGQHQNIFSMGLTDAGTNITYPTWEEGVAAFGKWYRRLDDRGVDDCRKWRIYNPNGDYCSKVENLANQINTYLYQ